MGYIDLIITLIPIFVTNLMIGSFCLKPKKLSTKEERRKKAKIEDMNIAESKVERQKSRLSPIPLAFSSAQLQNSRLGANLLAFLDAEHQSWRNLKRGKFKTFIIESFCLKPKKLSTREERRKKAKIKDMNIAESNAERQKSRLNPIPLAFSSAQLQNSRLSAILLAFLDAEHQSWTSPKRRKFKTFIISNIVQQPKLKTIFEYLKLEK